LIFLGCLACANSISLDDRDEEQFKNILIKCGLSQEQASHFLAKLSEWHPGDSGKIYHSLAHSLIVTDLMWQVIEKNQDLDLEQKKMLVFSAALHDVHPTRLHNTPPKVAETLNFLDSPTALFLKNLVDIRKVKSLILYTDFSPVSIKQAQIIKYADEFAIHSDPIANDWLKTWGRNLAVIDKAAMYTRDERFAEQAVCGLAFELRTESKSSSPSNEMMLKNTYKFLSSIEEDLKKLHIPKMFQDNFQNVLTHFEKIGE